MRRMRAAEPVALPELTAPGRRVLRVGAVIAVFAIASVGATARAAAATLGAVAVPEAAGRIPLGFEPNQGQVDGRISFLARGDGYRLFLTPTEAVVDLRARERYATARGRRPLAAIVAERFVSDASMRPRDGVLRMRLAGASPEAKTEPLEPLPGQVNYLVGNDPAKWRLGVPTYAKVHVRQVYPGVDLVYYGNHRGLEYDFVVAPGVDPGIIALEFEGAERLEISASGDLVIHTAARTLRQRKPFVYQVVGGARQPIPASYVLKGGNRVGFRLDGYYASLPLVIDPVLTLAAGRGVGDFVAVDALGNSYVAGFVDLLDPTTRLCDATRGCSDVFVAKLDPAGTTILWQTVLGGNRSEFANGIALDSAGFLYITGSTNSSDFPTANAIQPALAVGSCRFGASTFPCDDAFVAKLDTATGTTVAYATYFGGSGQDFGMDIKVDAAGNAFVTGGTASTDFRTTANAAQTAFGGGPSDAFVLKLSPTGTLLYSTYLGGSGNDSGSGIALDSAGNVTVTGETFGTQTVTIVSAESPSLIATADVAADQSAPIEETLVAAVTTFSNNFPVKNAVQPSWGGPCDPGIGTLFPCPDAFVATVNPAGGGAGSTLVNSSFLGGAGIDFGVGVGVDSSGNAYVTGGTDSTTGLIIANPVQAGAAGGFDTFVTKLTPPPLPTAPLVVAYSTYLGGNGDDIPTGIAVTPAGDVFLSIVSNSTVSTTLPTVTSPDTSQVVITLLTAQQVPTQPPTVASVPLGVGSADTGSTLGLAVDPAGNVVVAGASASGLGVKLTNAFVRIDIKPGELINTINLKSGGKVKVAILSSATLDAPTAVDRTTLTFGRTGDEASLVRCDKKPKDVDKDGRPDLICRFSIRRAAFQLGETQATLKGKTVDGTPFIGSDSVQIVPDGKDDDDKD